MMTLPSAPVAIVAGRSFVGAVGEAISWIVNPISLPWSQSQNRGGRLTGEVVGVAALPLVYNWLAAQSLNVRIIQPNLLVLLVEVGLPLMAVILIGFLPSFRDDLDAYQASLVGLWIQRVLTVQLLLLGVWAAILVSRGIPIPVRASEFPVWLTFEFAFWVSGVVVSGLAVRSMKSGPSEASWRDVLLAVGLYLCVLVVLRFANIPEPLHPWFAADLPPS